MAGETQTQTRAPDRSADAQADVEQQLREKIRSKMDVAKLLGGVVTVLLALFLDQDRLDSLGDPVEVKLAAIAFIASLLLFLATMDGYDSLLMPRTYWRTEPRPAHRLALTRVDSRDPDAIYRAMVVVWDRLFLPAATALTMGVILLADAAIDPALSWRLISALTIVVVLGYTLAVRPLLVKR